MKPLVQISNVTVLKSGQKLFQDFSFTIHHGEHWLIQGRNGSGKTTLLNLLAGALHPVSGKIHHTFIRQTGWKNVYRERKEKIHFAASRSLQTLIGEFHESFYQQRYYSMGDSAAVTVRDVFADDIDRLLELEISQAFHIRSLLDLPIVRLSNGQLKKVVILRQLVKSVPVLLLLDYPFDGLDAESRREFISFIDSLIAHFEMHVVIVDHGNALPKAINRHLVLDNFQISHISDFAVGHPGSSISDGESRPVKKAGASPVVEMRNVTIQYGTKKVISNLNWQIRKGERWALTGPNGSGKTTLFSLIYADHPMAYSQKVFLFGRRRGTGESIWDIKKRINYFGPEHIHFFDPANLQMSGRAFIMAQAHQQAHRLESLIDFFSIQEWADKKILHLSSGQLQLLLLINLFLDDRELLLLDEPFQFLDPHNHHRLTDYLNHYLNPEITLVLITHDEHDVSRWTRFRKQL